MATYVLVHGAWCGAWCWERIAAKLEGAGHHVVTFDLPGRGSDTKPIQAVTLEDYVGALERVMQTQEEPVILVGHSLGGIIISQYAERHPETVRKLVFFTAFLVGNGDTMLKWVTAGKSCITMERAKVTPDGVIALSEEILDDVGYNECLPEQRAQDVELFCPDSMVPWQQPLELTEERFGRVPKVYIYALRDQGISIEIQRQMSGLWHCEKTMEVDTNHILWNNTRDASAAALLACAED